VLLEGLDNIRNVRKQILQRALYEAESDNIKSRVMRQAAGIERWAEVQPSMFEDTLDQELGKYDKFKTDLEDGAVEQQKLLEEIEVSVLSAPSCE
jgi:programmed cell death 6-interacting protein